MRLGRAYERICRCSRVASNFRSRSAWISCCRPVSMSFGVMWPVALFRRTLFVRAPDAVHHRAMTATSGGARGKPLLGSWHG